MIIEILWKELIDRGLNTKVPNYHSKQEAIIKDIVTEKIKNKYPRDKFPAWHFNYIRYYSASDKYVMEVAPGKAVVKG